MLHHMGAARGSHPTRIRSNILRDHLGLFADRLTAGRIVGFDRRSLDWGGVAGGKRGRDAVLECLATPINRVNAAVAIRRRPLEQPAYRGENFANVPP